MKIAEMEKLSMRDLMTRIDNIIERKKQNIKEVIGFARTKLNWIPDINSCAEINMDLSKEFPILDMYGINEVLPTAEYAMKLVNWKNEVLEMFSRDIDWIGEEGKIIVLNGSSASFERFLIAMQSDMEQKDGWIVSGNNYGSTMITIESPKLFKEVKKILERSTEMTEKLINSSDMEELAMIAKSSDKNLLSRIIFFKASKIMKDEPVLNLNYYLIKKEIDKQTRGKKK